MSDQEPAPFAIASDGATLVAGDGPELLVWRGDGAPAWKRFTDGVTLAVAVTADQVLALDTEGTLRRFRRGDGEELGAVHVARAPLGMEVAPDGTVGVVNTDGVVLASPGASPQVVPVPGASAFAFGPGGQSVGVGTRSGRFLAIERASGAAWGASELGGPVAGVAWSALGAWVVGVDRKLFRVSGDASTVVSTIAGADTPITGVACASNGLVVAANTHDRVELYQLHTNASLGEFLLRRRIGAVAFGPGLALAIGLDDGDGNVVDLGSGASFRTEPHPGRGRNTWRLENKLDFGAVRGAIAFHQAKGAPIARYVPPPAPGDAAAGGGGRGCLGGCLALAGVALVLAVLCSGVVGTMYFLRSTGLWELLPLR